MANLDCPILCEAIESYMKSLDAKKTSALVIRCWMTTNGMWLYHCLFDGGIYRVDRIDIGPIRSMGTKRIRDERGLINEIMRIFGLFNIISEDFKGIFPQIEQFFWDPEKMICSFHNPMGEKAGMGGGCRCDLFSGLERLFDTLEIDYKVIPSRRECMVEDGGNCLREYIFKNL